MLHSEIIAVCSEIHLKRILGRTWNSFNTLPSCHVDRLDCYSMHRWQVTYFDVFYHDVLHLRLSAGLAHLSLKGYWQLDCRMGVSRVTKKQSAPDPLHLESLDSNKETTHSDTLSVFLPNFLPLQSWLCVRGSWKRTIFCVSYMQIHVLMSLIIVTMKFLTVTVTSPQLFHVNNCNLLP